MLSDEQIPDALQVPFFEGDVTEISEQFIEFCHANGIESGEYISGIKYDSNKERCILCELASCKGMNGDMAFYNRNVTRPVDCIIYDSRYFYVVPELGALKLGFLMIVPKEHYLSVAQYPPALLKEYQQVCEDLEEILKNTFGAKIVTFFEHGTAPGGYTSHKKSIVHAHTHVVTDFIMEDKYKEMVQLKTIDDINVNGKRVLVRCDFNVPLKEGVITDETRINAALPTIQKLLNDGGKVILCSHLGKVKEGPNEKESLAPVAKRLSEKLGKEVVFVSDYNVTGEAATAAVEAMKEGDVVLLQNTRFRGKEETKNGEEFSKELADLADVYVCDAFGSSHRAHASVAGVTKFITEKGGENAVGYLMQKEIDFLGNAVEDPVRPFVAILGGAKVADKLNVINNLLEKCDTLIIGGGMAYTFLKAQGYEIGKSLVDDEKLDYCKEMLAKAESLGKKILLPVDSVTIASFPSPIDAEVETEVYDATAMPADRMACDIGPKTAELFAEAVKSAKTVVWNGPMGVFENPTLAAGTLTVAKVLAETEATTIIGGGDSAAAVNQMGYGDKMSHISTGGGASLEFLEGKELPGVVAADDK